LKGYLSQQKHIEVIIEASNAVELINELKSKPADIVLLDIFMPELNGDEAVKIIRSQHPDTKVIILSMHTDLAVVNDLIDTGIHAYISKSDEPEQLLQAIRSVCENRIYKNKIFTEALYWNRQLNVKYGGINRVNNSLEDREKKILQLLWEEKSNKEIADEVFLSVRSIEKIRQSMKEKLGVKSTIGLIKYGLNNKIIGVDPVRATTMSSW
ncbi:MAG TPA: response regulator transcription factor, partial [Chitinophagaceae bacterium]|nr:response regulator transcription factor [Chitinophagaceae bacterium]